MSCIVRPHPTPFAFFSCPRCCTLFDVSTSLRWKVAELTHWHWMLSECKECLILAFFFLPPEWGGAAVALVLWCTDWVCVGQVWLLSSLMGVDHVRKSMFSRFGVCCKIRFTVWICYCTANFLNCDTKYVLRLYSNFKLRTHPAWSHCLKVLAM